MIKTAEFNRIIYRVVEKGLNKERFSSEKEYEAEDFVRNRPADGLIVLVVSQDLIQYYGMQDEAPSCEMVQEDVLEEIEVEIFD